MKIKRIKIVFSKLTLLSLFLICFLASSISSTTDDQKYAVERTQMVREQIELRGVKDKLVLNAMLKVPRHKFVSTDLQKYAYEDRPLPIGEGQTISQPYIVALMTELLRPKKGYKALEVGTGSGYQAAILSEIVKEVYTIEIFENLGKSAKERLKQLGYKKVEVKIGDGYYGWAEHAPFDLIVVTAAANHIPPSLIVQLKEGGRMCLPVGGAFHVQNLMVVEKLKGGKIRTENVLPVRFVPLLGDH